MKIFGVLITVFLATALSMPTAEENQEIVPQNDVVNAFRAEIERYFAEFQEFYALTNVNLRLYRLNHVERISHVYEGIMTAMGDKIEEVRQAAYELDDLIDAKREELGRINECLQGVINTRNANSAAVGVSIQRCAITANETLTSNLNNLFYPTFADIQEQSSTIPLSVIDVLSRGNVLEDEQEILVFLQERLIVMEMQWISQVSQLLLWETSRFVNEGLFLRSDMEICMGDATWEYLLVNSRLEGEVQDC